MKWPRILRDARGATVLEFALVAPAFLMFIFLMLEGGRMIFAKQALNELAAASARCAALKAPGCTSDTAAESWTATRGVQRSQLRLTADMVEVTPSTSCNGRTSMAKTTITMPYNKGAFTLLPQSAVPSTLTATSCFPVA